jgi:hypothetical protein
MAIWRTIILPGAAANTASANRCSGQGEFTGFIFTTAGAGWQCTFTEIK